MRVLLIAFDFVYPGIKMLSSYLRFRGWETSIVYLPLERSYDCSYNFPEALKESLDELAGKYDLIGLSVMTHNFYQAADITKSLRSSGRKMILWGGIHPTVDPRGSLEHADGAAIGESEESLSELATSLEQGGDPYATAGFWFRHSGKIIRNRLRHPPVDLESLPLPDIGWEGHYIREGESIVALDKSRLKALFMVNGLCDLEGNFYPSYLCVLSRGCPFTCTFCCNNLLTRLFGKDRQRVRIRSLENIMAEIKLARRLVPEIGFISIQDDNFLAQPAEFIEDFSSHWRKEIGLPFKISGSVNFINQRRIAPLVEAGMMHIEVGVQSGSDRLNQELYKRKISAEKILEAATLLNRYQDRLLPAYDFIFDNPYETALDRLKTARLINKLPRPYAFSSFSLVFFPGTQLYERARRDNLISDEIRQIYSKKSNEFNLERVTYLKLVSLLLPSLPAGLGKILTWTPWAMFWELPIWDSLFAMAARTLVWFRRKKIIRRVNTSRFFRLDSIRNKVKG